MQSPDDCPLEPKALEGSEQGQVRQTPSDAESSASLCTSAELNLGDRVLGKVEKNSFLTLPGKGGLSKPMPSKPSVPTWETIVRSFTVIVQRGQVSLWTFFSLVGVEVSGSRHHQLSGSIIHVSMPFSKKKTKKISGSNWSGIYMFVGSIPLLTVDFSHPEGVSVSAK